MMVKIKFVGVFAICSVITTALGTTAGVPAQADGTAAGLLAGVSQLRQACGTIGADARLAAAAQRHANDMLQTSTHSHTGSDGSSPRVRLADAGYHRPGTAGEIVYWGTGSAANASSAIDWWMGSPRHRAAILNCAFTTAGFATARAGNTMTAVVEFAGP